MKLMTLKQYMKMSKPALIRKITKALRAMPKAKLARLCYNITKAKLPRLKTIRQKALPKRKARFKKGSPEAKRYMAILRGMRTKKRGGKGILYDKRLRRRR